MTKLKFIEDDVTASLNGIEIRGNKGEVVEANESLSMFLTLKGWAEVVR